MHCAWDLIYDGNKFFVEPGKGCVMHGVWMRALVVMLLVVGMSMAGNAEEKVDTSKVQKVTIPLWPGTPPASNPDDDFIPTLTTMLLPTDKPLGVVLVLPGGGYGGRAEHERTPIAEYFNRQGMHGIFLDYRVSPHRHPAPLLDACRAVRLIRQHAKEWKVDPDKIAALGFSAGGHLTGSLGVFYENDASKQYDDLIKISARPDAIVLCYPVISSSDFGHRGSFNNLMGPDASDDQRKTMSLELHAHAEVPPTFLWSTADDQGVPVENSLRFAMALRKLKVPYEMHVFPTGRHGMGLALDDPQVGQWPGLCTVWLRAMGW